MEHLRYPQTIASTENVELFPLAKIIEQEQATAPDISYIKLKGEPYQRAEMDIDCNVTLNNLAESTNYVRTLPDRVADAEKNLEILFLGDGYHGIDRKIKHGEDLTFEDSYSLATFVISALNRPLNEILQLRMSGIENHQTHLLQAVSLLSSISAKEAYRGLTAEEIAGVVAATVELDTIVRTHCSEPIIAFGGMGGDKGYEIDDQPSKLFNLSTLSAAALAVEGKTYKHHSYPNTSKLAGQNVIEKFGARSDFHTAEAFSSILDDSDLLMSSCHDTRTLHTLSHQLKGETINHVIGPLAYTLSADTEALAFVGVNEKVHPSTIVDALKILDSKGIQKFGNSAVYCGTDLTEIDPHMLDTDSYMASSTAKDHIRIDEIAPAPYVSLVSFLANGENAGTYSISPEDFFSADVLCNLTLTDLLIPNDAEEIMAINRDVISGLDTNKMRYLSMTIGLGLFTKHFINQENALNPDTHKVNREYLQACTDVAFNMIKEGLVEDKIKEYVKATKKYAGPNQNTII